MAALTVLAAGAVPAIKLGKASRQANIEVKAPSRAAALPGVAEAGSRADDLSGSYVDGVYQVITSPTTGDDIGYIVARGGGFTMEADPAVENGYILKNLFETMFFDSSHPGTVNDIKAVYNPETNRFSINPGQKLMKINDPTEGEFDIEVITCDNNYYYDDTLPIEFTYSMGQFRLESPAIFFASKQGTGYLTMTAYLLDVSAWIPNGEMKYHSNGLDRDEVIPIYGVYTNGHVYIYNFADADILDATPFVREDNNTKAVFRSIPNDPNYNSAAYILQYFPSEDMNINGPYYLTAVEVNSDGTDYTPVSHPDFDFYVAGDIVTDTPTECKLTLPLCGLLSATDTPWDIMSGCEITFNPSTIAGIQEVAADVDNSNAPVVYYNLQGMRVDNPQGGIFIRRQGTESTKILVK